MKSKKISFPHLGDYYVPIRYLLNNLTNLEVVKAPSITKKTIELGLKYAPETICLPFKYNLGNFIESLDNGIDTLITAGGGCRYGYYAELHEKILRDLGYKFNFIKLIKNDHLIIRYAYQIMKKLNPKLNFLKFIHYAKNTIFMMNRMDKIDNYIRLNKGFAIDRNAFDKLKKEYLYKIQKKKTCIGIWLCERKYLKKFKKIEINKPKDRLRIGIIGELFTSMETNASFNLEDVLIDMNIEVKRYTNLTYLLYEKFLKKKKIHRKVKKYCKYSLGADGMDNVYRCIDLKEKKYDGVIHIKPFGCTPEVFAYSIIDKVCEELDLPIIYFSFDGLTQKEAFQTRIEAFVDMLRDRKEHNL